MNKYKKIISLFLVLLVMASVLSISIFAEITPGNAEEPPGTTDGTDTPEDPITDTPEDPITDTPEDPTTDTSEDPATGDVTSEDPSSLPESASSTPETTSTTEGSSSATTGAATTSGSDTSMVSSENSEPEYVVFGKIETRKNEVSDFMTIIGIVCILLGVVGIASVIAWTVAGRNTSKTPDEEVYQAVGIADARNRAEKPRAQEAPVSQPTPVNQAPVQRTMPQPRPVAPTPVQRPAPKKRTKNFDTEEIIREALKDKENNSKH